MWPQFPQSQNYPENSQFPINYSAPPWAMGNYSRADFHTPKNDTFLGRMKNEREKNRATIENFVDHCQPENKIVQEEKTPLSICQAKETLVRAFGALQNLEKLRKELSLGIEDVEWSQKWQESEKIRDDYREIIGVLEQPENVLDELKKRLNHRKKKRLRQARKRAQWKMEKKLKIEKRARRHDEVDFWIREKREAIERDKQADNLRKDADIVLADVRSKRNDAKKFLALLQELQNLRKVKVNIARARGENLPIAADQVFDNIIGQLVEQWSCLDGEYSIEEKGLKLMLKADNEEKIEKRKRSTFDDWERVLFGRKLQKLCDPWRGSVHGLLRIRSAWDKYANFEKIGSPIPIGWIMPVPPTSAAWQRCLKQ